MKIALLATKNGLDYFSAAEFNDEDIKIATAMCANIKHRYSKTGNGSYLANVCKHCNAFVGDFYMHEYYDVPHEKETEHYCKCLNCM